MTREEAIKYLTKEQKKTEAVVALTERDFGVSESAWHTEYEAFALAILALREQEELESKLRALESSGWISVEERLPEQRDGYLVATEDGDVYDAEFIPGVKQWWVGDEWRLDITHWMPLPEPPKEEV